MKLKKETMQQKFLFEWASHIPELKYMFSTLNGVHLSAIQSIVASQTGLKKGVLDVVLLLPRGKYHGLLIEMKVKPNKPTAEQLDFLKHHNNLGYKCIVCYSWIEAKDQIINYLKEANVTNNN